MKLLLLLALAGAALAVTGCNPEATPETTANAPATNAGTPTSGNTATTSETPAAATR